MTDVIEIVCGIDSKFVPHMAVVLKSLTEYNPNQRFRVHVIHESIPDDLQKRVEECNKEIKLNWIKVANHRVSKLDDFLHISRAAYLRLTILEALDPSIKRVLYLDADLVINGNITSFWNTDLGDKVCAAVVDSGVDTEAFAQKAGLPGQGSYFNAGVILFDLEKLRSKPYLEEAIKIVTTPNNGWEYADQDALNIVLWNNWLPLDPGWNFQRRFLYDGHAVWDSLSPQKYQPAIIHFTEAWKPWKNDEWHPCRWLYIRTLLKTPFKSDVLKSGGINFYHIFKSWLKWTLKRPPMFKLPRRQHRQGL